MNSGDCFRLTNEGVVIEIPALPRPTPNELKKEYPFIKEVKSDLSPTAALTLRLATVLKSDEPSINGVGYERRIDPLRTQAMILGLQHAEWLCEQQQKYPALILMLGKIDIDFSGLILFYDDGYCNIPCLRIPCLRDWCDGQWDVYFRWLGSDFDRGGRLAVSGK